MSDSLTQIRADAVQALNCVLRWELSAAHWDQLGEALDALAVAEDEGANAIAMATADLELAAPMRITPIGAATDGRQPAPPHVRERVNELIHLLCDSQRSEMPAREGQAADPGEWPEVFGR